MYIIAWYQTRRKKLLDLKPHKKAHKQSMSLREKGGWEIGEIRPLPCDLHRIGIHVIHTVF